MDIKTVTQDILAWSETFVEVPHAALGGWAPCPFARQARLRGTVGIFVGKEPYFDLESRSAIGMQQYEVIIYAYDPGEWTYNYFSPRLKAANRDFLLAADFVLFCVGLCCTGPGPAVRLWVLFGLFCCWAACLFACPDWL